MASPTYAELLKHPLWQRKRLQLLESNGFTCALCSADTKTLHIHHWYYEKGLKPWEYPDETMTVLCEDCYEREQHRLREIHRYVGFLADGLGSHILGYLKALYLGDHPENKVKFSDLMEVSGATTALQLSEEALVNALGPDRSITGDEWHRLICKRQDCRYCHA